MNIREIKKLYSSRYKQKSDLGISITKKSANHYNENHKNQKYSPCSWTTKINFSKMSQLFKTIYTFNAVPIEIVITLFTALEKTILKCIHKILKSYNSLFRW